MSNIENPSSKELIKYRQDFKNLQKQDHIIIEASINITDLIYEDIVQPFLDFIAKRKLIDPSDLYYAIVKLKTQEDKKERPNIKIVITKASNKLIIPNTLRNITLCNTSSLDIQELVVRNMNSLILDTETMYVITQLAYHNRLNIGIDGHRKLEEHICYNIDRIINIVEEDKDLDHKSRYQIRHILNTQYFNQYKGIFETHLRLLKTQSPINARYLESKISSITTIADCSPIRYPLNQRFKENLIELKNAIKELQSQ